jgi:type II secretory pathway pseudopilin PulG
MVMDVRREHAGRVPGSNFVRREQSCVPGSLVRVDNLAGHGHGHGHGHGRGAEAGYTMVMFVMIIAVMSIAMGVAVQTAEFQMRREREAELIFRGQQFIEAIRLYKIKYGRYPMQLKEIYEAKPRVIRKKWKDPITDSENWGIIFLGQEGGQLGGVRGPGSITGAGGSVIGTQRPFGSDSGKDPRGGARGSGPGGESVVGTPGPYATDQSGLPSVGADRKVGPIVGVHSTSCDEAIKVYEGRTTYCEWRFIFKEDEQQGQRRGGRPRQPRWHPGATVPPTPPASNTGNGPRGPGPVQSPPP